MKFIIGADPEMFLIDKDKNPISAIGLIPGEKHDPYKISDKGHSVQTDNVLLEFNIPTCKNAEELEKNINFVLNWFDNNLPEGTTYKISTSEKFDDKELQNPKALEFGCDPDFNAWDKCTNISPSTSGLKYRSAGGHIHISYPEATMEKSVLIVMACDLFLGVPSILFDQDNIRRSLYGKAGAFRFKTYSNGDSGVEYRTLSNFWINNQKFMELIFVQLDKIFNLITLDETYLREILDKEENRIRECIDTANVELAQSLVNEYSLFL